MRGSVGKVGGFGRGGATTLRVCSDLTSVNWAEMLVGPGFVVGCPICGSDSTVPVTIVAVARLADLDFCRRASSSDSDFSKRESFSSASASAIEASSGTAVAWFPRGPSALRRLAGGSIEASGVFWKCNEFGATNTAERVTLLCASALVVVTQF